jgi:hypothetical protein
MVGAFFIPEANTFGEGLRFYSLTEYNLIKTKLNNK